MGTWKLVRRHLSAGLELPEDALGGAYRLQLIGDTAIVCGAKKLLKYKSEEIDVLTADAVLSFSGVHLKCAYFCAGTAEIVGELHSVGIEKR